MGSMDSELLMELLFGLRAFEQQNQTIFFNSMKSSDWLQLTQMIFKPLKPAIELIKFHSKQ